MILINHTNYPSERWSEAQRARFTEIIDLPFPNIDPCASQDEVRDIVKVSYKAIVEIAQNIDYDEIGICLQGEFSYCYSLFLALYHNFNIAVYIPTTERKAIEKDGAKTSVFEFVRWRII